MTGPRTPQTWQEKAGAAIDFSDLKGVVETLLKHLGVSEVAYEPASVTPFVPGRAANLLIANDVVGQLGEVHPLVKEKFELPAEPVCLAEFDLDLLLAHAHPVPIVEPVSRYPGVAEDLAVVLDESVPAEQVRQIIVKAGGKLLTSVKLFDIYRGDQIPAAQKSLAFSLFFQAPDRTLTDKEVRTHHHRIVKLLGKELDARLRA